MESLTIIDQQYKNGNFLVEYLKEKHEITLFIEAENNFKKNILLSAASFYEKEVSDLIVKFAETQSNKNMLIISIITEKAVNRQFHTYFDWGNSKNANKFFSIFGSDFKLKMVEKVKKDDKLDESIKAFLDIGHERNLLVHRNFAEIILEKTAEEIYELYKKAQYFISILKSELIIE
ncbi:HEPN domain-containing protein [Flavobacterium alkalisoli]|uniref:HEPN domain-containing protein n=1 Tax=Flavobacterium alkalisoli TaxID=2602769 RepID=UPI003A8F9632